METGPIINIDARGASQEMLVKLPQLLRDQVARVERRTRKRLAYERDRQLASQLLAAADARERQERLTTDPRGTGLHPVWKTAFTGLGLVATLLALILIAGCSDSKPNEPQWQEVSDVTQLVDPNGRIVAFDLRVRRRIEVGSRCYEYADGEYQCWFPGMVCDLKRPEIRNVKSWDIEEGTPTEAVCRLHGLEAVHQNNEQNQ